MKFSGDKRTVIDGPFTETKELIAGFTIIQVKSLEEAIEWVKRAPNLSPNGEAEVEIRKLMDVEDFGDEFTPNPEIAKVKYLADDACSSTAHAARTAYQSRNLK